MIHVYPMEALHSLSHCMEHCEKLGGRSPSVKTFEDWQILHQELQFLRIDLLRFQVLWLAATEGDKNLKLSRLDHWPEGVEATEGVWRDYYTGEELDNYTKPWPDSNLDELNGESYNCIIYGPSEDVMTSWQEWDCSDFETGCPCSYKTQPILHLRGYCPGTYIEHERYTTNQLPTDPNDIVIVGMATAQIRHVSALGGWILQDDWSDASAVINASQESYALGKHTWTISGDSEKCSKGQSSYKIQMKLTGCKEDEFTCDDGQCVRMEKRCNQVPDCRDKSDEKGCRLIILEDGYNKNIPPIKRSALGSPIPASVSISIILMKVVDIDEVDHSIQLQFQISLQWRENRAKYLNLKGKTSLNALTDVEILKLWLPFVIYYNTDQKESTRLGWVNEWTTRVTVAREGNFTRAGLDEVDEAEIFEGGENNLLMTQTYTHEFQCQYKLQRYPFDTQVENFSDIQG